MKSFLLCVLPGAIPRFDLLFLFIQRLHQDAAKA